MTTVSSAPAAPEILAVRGAVKRYGVFAALRGVDLTVHPGTIHALLGHNGAGKSTLIEIIGGANPLTEGTIVLEGEPRQFTGPREANQHGISVIHQHLSLVDSLSVADNVFLGDEITGGGFLRRREQVAETRRLLERVGASCRPGDLVSQLPAAQRQLVEIAKALRRDTRLLILDEPTAALSDTESQRLGSLILQLRGEGLGIIYVTHLLQEVERLADEVTVLEDGRVSFSGSARELTRADLVRLISGDRAAHPVPSETALLRVAARADDAPAIETTGLHGDGFGPMDLTLAPGEIVGLFGMLGSGRGEFLETLAGARRASSGIMRFSGQSTAFSSPAQASRSGVHLVGADRARSGVLHGMSVFDNMLISAFPRLSHGSWRDARAERGLYDETVRAFDLRATARSMIGTLSGGNQQKVMLGRAAYASEEPRVLLLDGPTQGVDVGARADIYRSLRTLADRRGVAVLFSSSDPEEMLDLADRILVVRGGEVVAELNARTATDTRLISLASHGADTAEATAADAAPDPDPTAPEVAES